MEHEEITRQTVAAFEDLMTDEERGVEPEAAVVEEEPEPEDDREQEETPEEPAEDDEEDEDEPAEEEEAEEEEPEEEVAAERDPEVLAFLAKYGGDVEQALKGGSELYHLINRQGREKNAALERVQQLEDELARERAFGRARSTPLTEEARQWVEEASGSDNPAGYVQMAVDAGQYELARAVCEEWAHQDPYNAARVGAQVDTFEQQATTAEPEPEPFELSRMLEAAREQFPDMHVYWGQMTRLIGQLGDGHHLVVAARSSDVNEAARGIVGLYDMAKATSVNVREAKEKVRAGKRREAVDVREKAQVTSAATSPARSQAPRQTPIMPGLTLEDLEAAFAEAE